MKKIIIAMAGVGLSFNLFAANIDLEAVMKEIGLHYKKAVKAESVADMQTEVDKIDMLIEEAKKGEFSAERDKLYQEGYQKLIVAFDGVDASLANDDLDGARDQLKQINGLKKEYHKAAKNLN